MNQEKFGAFVCALRKEKGMTQKELGNVLGLSDKAVSKWERGGSLPDITMFDKIAGALGVSTLELMQGQRLTEEKLDRAEAEMVVRDTVGQAVIHDKKTKRRTILGTLCITAGTLLLATSVKYVVNYGLDRWADTNESSDHKCEIDAYLTSEDAENYFVTVEKVENYVWNYHVYGIDAEGNSEEIFILRENGMQLDRNPKLIRRENTLYLLFEGLDNEDPVERIYDGKMGADPQGFLPYLYRYDIVQGTLERIAVDWDSETMLVDAFSYEGEDIYISQRFKGLFGGLHLGFYMGDKTCSSQGMGKKYENLFGDGGLKSTGCVDGDWYYVAGQNGIYGINLATGKGVYKKERDFSYCYRSEIQMLQINGEKRYVVAAAFYDELNRYGEADTMRTLITVYDENWNEIQSAEIPVGISGVEWGSESVMVTALEDGKQYQSYLIDCTNCSVQQIKEVEIELYPNMHYLDEAECLEEQWVYVESKEGYYYTSEKPVFVAE